MCGTRNPSVHSEVVSTAPLPSRLPWEGRPCQAQSCESHRRLGRRQGFAFCLRPDL